MITTKDAIVALADIEAAQRRIQEYALPTPLIRALILERRVGARDLYLKAESLQRVGAFKFRGAFNTLKILSETERPKHVVTSSSGNHGQAVAAAGQILGIGITVVMPENAIQAKIDAVKGYGAAVEFAGTTSPEREARAQQIGRETGATVIGSFDDARIIAGQGTCGLEILDGMPDVDVVIVPIGGGGLIGGIATAIKEQNPDVRVVGVEPEGASDAYQSMQAGRIISIEKPNTIADGLRTSSPGKLNFEIMRRYVDEIVLVSEESIRAAVKALALEAKLVAEPSGAVTTAALLSGKIDVTGIVAVAVISGGNVDPPMFAEIVTSG